MTSFLTYRQFEEMLGIRPTTGCKLRKQGNWPRVVDLGGRVMRIAVEDAEAWLQDRRNPSPDEQAEIERRAEERRSLGRHAASSPRHISNTTAERRSLRRTRRRTRSA